MIKPEEFNSKLEVIIDDYRDEMFDYLNKSRDLYVEKNIELERRIKGLKKLCIYFFICFVIEFILFLISINL